MVAELEVGIPGLRLGWVVELEVGIPGLQLWQVGVRLEADIQPGVELEWVEADIGVETDTDTGARMIGAVVGWAWELAVRQQVYWSHGSTTQPPPLGQGGPKWPRGTQCTSTF